MFGTKALNKNPRFKFSQIKIFNRQIFTYWLHQAIPIYKSNKDHITVKLVISENIETIITLLKYTAPAFGCARTQNLVEIHNIPCLKFRWQISSIIEKNWYDSSFFRFLGNAGYGTLIWVVTAEILPPKVRSIANSIIICFAFLCGFIIAKTFVDLLEGLQRSGTVG